jgi:hypothetical protein
MRKFWSVALPFGKVACVVRGYSSLYKPRKGLKINKIANK